ncbi:MAG: FAD-dependent oxidoreductase [Candidatus Omnitrophota bacterium]|nr:FAD-dependent oxidoreductase [Candidatus Omnitrophota bacterium]
MNDEHPITYVVMGAGPAGLAAAHALADKGKRVILLEADPLSGGMAKTLQKGALKYDLGPHNLHSIYPDIIGLIKRLLDNQIEEHKIVSRIYFRDRVVPYPLTGMKVFTSIPLYLSLAAFFDFMVTRAKRRLSFSRPDEGSFKEWIINRFGNVLYEIYFEPYASKVWKMDPSCLSKIIAEKRIPVLSLFAIIKRALFNEKKFHPEDSTQIYNFYPKGGVGVLMQKMEERILGKAGEVIHNARVENIYCRDNRVAGVQYTNKEGKTCLIENARLISSIPLNELIQLLEGVDPSVKSDSSKLSYTSMRLFYMIVNKKEVLDLPWIYFSDKDVIFNRLSDMSKFSKTLVSDNKTILCLEVSCRINDELWTAGDNALFELMIPVLEKYGIVRRQDIESVFSEYIEYSHPLFFKGFEDIVGSSLKELEKIDGLITIGRQGLYTYANIDEAMKMGITAAELITRQDGRINYKNIFPDHLFYTFAA